MGIDDKITPDDIIILDYLIYSKGNDAEIESWDKIKREIKTQAHRRMLYGD
jgi:hypothetical protein